MNILFKKVKYAIFQKSIWNYCYIIHQMAAVCYDQNLCRWKCDFDSHKPG